VYTILHIENSEFFIKIFRNIFAQKKIEYIAAKSIEEAKKVISNKDVDLLLSAMEIPNGNLKKFLEELTNDIRYAQIPVFVITGDEKMDQRKEIFEFGIVDYILKRTSIDDIVKVIENFINEDQMINKLKRLKIAVLDDSQLERQVIETIFNDKKIWNVDYYEKGKDLTKTEKEYDIYLVDMVLEDCSGEEVIINVREKNSKAVIIAVSAIKNEKTISHILSIGADDYIIKPYVTDVFMARLKSRIRSYLLIKELSDKLERRDKK